MVAQVSCRFDRYFAASIGTAAPKIVERTVESAAGIENETFIATNGGSRLGEVLKLVIVVQVEQLLVS